MKYLHFSLVLHHLTWEILEAALTSSAFSSYGQDSTLQIKSIENVMR